MDSLRKWLPAKAGSGSGLIEHIHQLRDTSKTESVYKERIRMAERYHRAARDGYLDLLREATRKDCDKQDEDGMTPTLWAAYYGNLDALRLILSRGGNPDKADHLGYTALHHAACRGHIPCVTFLVNFGVNIWALDNDLHTSLDVAGINEHMGVVSYLDSVVAKQAALNKKLVKKYKERSVLEAQKRIKDYNKRQMKSQKKAKMEDKKLTQIRDRLETVTVTQSQRSPSSLSRKSVSDYDSGFSWRSKETAAIRPYSDHFSTTSLKKHQTNGHSTGIMRKIHKKKFENGSIADFRVSEIQEGKKSMRSLTGLRRDAQVLYVGEGTKTNSLGYMSSTSEPDFGYSNGDSGVASYDSGHVMHESASLFDRPGLGTLAFLRTPVSGAMLSLPTDDERGNRTKSRTGNGKLHREGSYSDSIGTLGSLAKRVKGLPWDEDELESLNEIGATNKHSTLELFLGSHGLTEFIQTLNQEKIDLEALLLCSDDDLKDIGIPLGPRRKMLDAANKRKAALSQPGNVCDTRL